MVEEAILEQFVEGEDRLHLLDVTDGFLGSQPRPSGAGSEQGNR